MEILEKKQVDNDFEIRCLKTENKRLLRKIKDNQHELDEMDERFIDLERTVNNVDQYIRRENFEVSGIPDDISQDNLEDEVINIINTITNDTIASRDIEACHRLKKDADGSAKVIVRMANRKHTVNVLKNKKKLKEKSTVRGNNVFINENLSDETKRIFNTARDLKKNNHLFSCWTFNGKVNIKMKENDQKTIRILHMSEFEDFFSLKTLGWI